ncbi:MAG: GNAT family N-acetyltransferase [Thermomicrobiales bacterium]
MRNPMLVGERVYLRPLELADAEDLARGAVSEPETFFQRGRFPASAIAFEHMIREVNGKPHPLSEIFFAVCLKEDDRLIGGVNVDHIDWIDRTGETGSGFLPEFRGQGYGTEAKFLLLEYCFDRMHFHAIRSHVFEPNSRSAAALLKQGYRPAGRLHWEDIKNGVYQDTLVFDVLRDEYLKARERWRCEMLTASSSTPAALDR